MSTLAVARAVTPTEMSDQGSAAKTSAPTLTVVKDSDTTVQQAAVEETTPAPTDETPITKPEATANDKSDEMKAGDDKRADETNEDENKGDGEKKVDAEKKSETDTKPHTEKKSQTDKNPEADNKDADSGKTAA